MQRLEAHRIFFAKLVTANAGVFASNGRLVAAFASTPREQFVGKGPWRVFTPSGYIETPSDDPTFLYQDIVIALTTDGPINNGLPSLHAMCLASLEVEEGAAIVQIGAGTGYYTSLLSKLTGASGSVLAYEVDPVLAQNATSNLRMLPNVTVVSRSGAEGKLPQCDVIYVNAGATAPLDVWLDALHPGGRLLFPLTTSDRGGAMLLVTRGPDANRFGAHFVCRAMFIPCVGARDEETARAFASAFRGDGFRNVKSLHRNTLPDETRWCTGKGWWLSTARLS